MRHVRLIVFVCLFAAAGGPAIVAAADWDMDESWSDRFLLFSGVDLWRGGGFEHAGLLWSPGGLDREGFTVKTLLGGGRYRYWSGRSAVIGRQWLGTAMAGWRFKSGSFEATVYGGPDYQIHTLMPDDPGNSLRGSHIGLRVGADLWWEPGAGQMASASLSASSIGHGYWLRVAAGWCLFESVYVGPEAAASYAEDDRELRFGLHATALKLGGYEWSAGFGWVYGSDSDNGLYGRLGMLRRQ